MTLLCWHAARIAAGLNEWPAGWSPVSKALSHLFGSGDDSHGSRARLRLGAPGVHPRASSPTCRYSKHLHIATAAVNVLFGRTRRRGRLEPLRFDVPDDEMRFGVGTVADLTWKEVLDGFSCTECGRCQDACPAHATGKALSPKLLIMGVRDQVFAEGQPRSTAAS